MVSRVDPVGTTIGTLGIGTMATQLATGSWRHEPTTRERP